MTWTFVVNDADLDDLAEGQELVQLYDIAIEDGQGAVTKTAVSVKLVGTDDSGPPTEAEIVTLNNINPTSGDDNIVLGDNVRLLNGDYFEGGQNSFIVGDYFELRDDGLDFDSSGTASDWADVTLQMGNVVNIGGAIDADGYYASRDFDWGYLVTINGPMYTNGGAYTSNDIKIDEGFTLNGVWCGSYGLDLIEIGQNWDIAGPMYLYGGNDYLKLGTTSVDTSLTYFYARGGTDTLELDVNVEDLASFSAAAGWTDNGDDTWQAKSLDLLWGGMYLFDFENVVVNVLGLNIAPVIVEAGTVKAGSVSELPDGDANEGAADLVANGTIQFDDVDAGDTHSVTITPDGTEYLGALSYTQPTSAQFGLLPWVFTVADADLEAMDASDQRVQTYSVVISDQDGATVSETITIALNGADDPVIVDFDTLDLHGLGPVRYVGLVADSDGNGFDGAAEILDPVTGEVVETRAFTNIEAFLDDGPFDAKPNGTVDGLSVGELMDAGYSDAQGDAIGSAGDVISGGAGDDTINGGAGADTIDAGADSDRIVVSSVSEAIGDVVIGGSAGSDADVLDLLGLGPTMILNQSADADGNGTDGTVVFRSATDGATLGTMQFFDIEQVLTDGPYEPVASPAVDGTDAGERMFTKYTDADGDAISREDDVINGNGGNDHIFANNGNDVLYGGDGADTLKGGNGDDTIYSGANDASDPGGWEEIYLGAGADVLVYEAGYDRDRLRDFAPGEDVIDLSALGLADFAELSSMMTGTTNRRGMERVDIDLGGSDEIRLLNVSLSDLGAGDFVL